MFVREMLAHYFLNCQELGIGNLLHVIEICFTAPLSNAESERVFSFLWLIFQRRGSPWAMKLWRFCCIFNQILTKARNNMEALLKCFWQSILMLLFTKENAAYRDMLTHKSKNLLKNPIKKLLLFLIQLSRKMHRT